MRGQKCSSKNSAIAEFFEDALNALNALNA